MIESIGSLTGELSSISAVEGTLNAGSVSFGTTNYDELDNKPSINGVELVGNKTSDDLGIATKEYVDSVITNSITTALEGEY